MIIISDMLQFLLFLAAFITLAYILGKYFDSVFTGKENILSRIIGPIEKYTYKLLGVNSTKQMNWKEYTWALLLLNGLGLVLLVAMQLLQNLLPANPEKLPAVGFWLSLNTAISFVTNTNWQAYAGETTLSYFVQMFGLTVQNFLSAATGIAVLLVLIRAIGTRKGEDLGNYWVDMTRAILYILIPLSIVMAVFLVSQGVVQSFSSYAHVTTIEGAKQVIPLGPAASQVAIKQLGTNGGGYFNANSAFPLENPTYWSNFFQVLSIILIPGALVFMFGFMLNSKKHARIVFGVMLFLFVAGVAVSYVSEMSGSPLYKGTVLMEGKEVRFGVFQSILWSVATTVASNGSVNAMHSSLSPVSGLICMLNMQLGEIIFGGVGSGLYGMFLFILLTVFIAGLMIGRTPEYFGKKIEAAEMRWVMAAVLIPNLVVLLFSAAGLYLRDGLAGIANPGPHGLSEVLYAFSSAANNNGSAFAGLNANTNFYNILTGMAMLCGRFGVIVPVMAISGSLVKKNIAPVTSGTFRTDTLLFAFLLTGVILIVGALTFFPVLAIGPGLEQLLMYLGKTF
ncbi:MAG: potassium-transporting ATPase subunit KdpA [Ignavibacteria bacterium]|nr:potassium-transporting ATPase subunit KdpA [Ignavibacteria bacterium]